MEILAVVIGYILGIIPFVFPKILEFRRTKIKKENEVEEEKTQAEIFDEWLNGAKKQEEKVINQQDIYNEYMTGEETMKGE